MEDFALDTKQSINSIWSRITSRFTTSFVDADAEKLNTQIHFDMDSVFFVCDNSTTGHICNDVQKFIPGSIRQTNKSLTTANGTGPCLQEGFQACKSFCMQVSSYAMTDEATKNTSNIIAFDDDEIQVSTPANEEDFNMLFMTNETVIFKDGKGINR